VTVSAVGQPGQVLTVLDRIWWPAGVSFTERGGQTHAVDGKRPNEELHKEAQPARRHRMFDGGQRAHVGDDGGRVALRQVRVVSIRHDGEQHVPVPIHARRDGSQYFVVGPARETGWRDVGSIDHASHTVTVVECSPLSLSTGDDRGRVEAPVALGVAVQADRHMFDQIGAARESRGGRPVRLRRHPLHLAQPGHAPHTHADQQDEEGEQCGGRYAPQVSLTAGRWGLVGQRR